MTGSGSVIASINSAVATDAAGNGNGASTSSDNTVTWDVSSPSGGSITYGSGYYTSASIGLTASDGTDTGSGINTATRTIQRRDATLSAGSCGAYGSFGTITPSGTYPNYTDATVSTANCYQYQYLVSDNLGNQATYVGVGTAKVDTGLPSTPGTPSPSPSSPTNSTSQTWSWTASSDAVSSVASYAWRTTGTSIQSGSTGSASVGTSLTEGAYTFFVKAIDAAGNEGSESSASLTVDTTAPTVTINQAVGQSDPTNASPVNFTVVFSEATTDFATGDVSISGSAGATTGTVTGSGTTYNVAVTGMSSSGSIIADIGSSVAHDASGNGNSISTSTDKTVTWNVTGPALMSIAITDTSGYTADATPDITISSSGSPTHVAFSCDAGSNWSSWITYASTISTFNITNGATGCTTADGFKTITAKLKDVLDNESGTSSDSTIYDTTGPIISSVAPGSVNNSDVTIDWTTNENSSSKIDYGVSDDYSSTTAEGDTSPRVTTHSITLIDLLSCTTYHYRVRSKDLLNNETVDTDNSFTTTGCIGSSPVIEQTAETITTSSGGSIALEDAGLGVSLAIPAGFSGSDADFQVKELDKSSVQGSISVPSGYSWIDNYVYDFKALSDVDTLITAFTQPITVTLSYQDSDITGIDETSLKIFRYDSSSWVQLDSCSVDATANTVTCTTSNFSIFGLFGTVTSSSGGGGGSTSNTSSSSSSSSGGGSPGPATCSNSPSSGVPDLFQINAQKSKVSLYFAPPPMPYNSFYISYSSKPDIWEYGTEFNVSNSAGVVVHDINALSPNTIYYFRVRSGNGCATGEWGNVMTVKTTSGTAKKTYYKNTKVAITQTVKKVVAKAKNVVTTPKTVEPTPQPTRIPYIPPVQEESPVYQEPAPIMQVETPAPIRKCFKFLWWCF